LDAFQSNSASELVNKIHEASSKYSAIIINPGAFTHYAWSISDALNAFDGPVVEVHISNPQSRESWRHTSVVAPVAIGTIAGFGQQSYVLGVQAIAHYLDNN
jgi:3-dehydroquinate dehydratase-2